MATIASEAAAFWAKRGSHVHPTSSECISAVFLNQTNTTIWTKQQGITYGGVMGYRAAAFQIWQRGDVEAFMSIAMAVCGLVTREMTYSHPGLLKPLKDNVVDDIVRYKARWDSTVAKFDTLCKNQKAADAALIAGKAPESPISLATKFRKALTHGLKLGEGGNGTVVRHTGKTALKRVSIYSCAVKDPMKQIMQEFHDKPGQFARCLSNLVELESYVDLVGKQSELANVMLPLIIYFESTKNEAYFVMPEAELGDAATFFDKSRQYLESLGHANDQMWLEDLLARYLVVLRCIGYGGSQLAALGKNHKDVRDPNFFLSLENAYLADLGYCGQIHYPNDKASCMGQPVNFEGRTHQIDVAQLLTNINECFTEEVQLQCPVITRVQTVLEHIITKKDTKYNMDSFLADKEIWDCEEVLRLTVTSLSTGPDAYARTTELYKQVAAFYRDIVIPKTAS